MKLQPVSQPELVVEAGDRPGHPGGGEHEGLDTLDVAVTARMADVQRLSRPQHQGGLQADPPLLALSPEPVPEGFLDTIILPASNPGPTCISSGP
jgi:hypothetical protein